MVKSSSFLSLVSILCLLISIREGNSQVVSSIDFTSNYVQMSSWFTNVIGVSMYFSQIHPYFSNKIFQSRLKNAFFDSGWSNLFYQSVHVSKGYKYNCSSIIYGSNVSCIMDLSINSSLLSTMKSYFYYYIDYNSGDLGFDIQMSNFSTSSKFFANFKSYMNTFWLTDSVNIELIDYGEQTATLYNRTYTVSNYISDATTILDYYYYNIEVTGPGITQNADSSWISQLNNIYNNLYIPFTFRLIVFLDSSTATISNLLNDTYSTIFLQKSLVDQDGITINLFNYDIGINQIRLTNDSGIDGITNSFAAALWALDTSLSFYFMNGKFISFYNPISASNQSIFGSAPDFNPTPIYYALLFGVYALRDYPDVIRPIVLPGLSANIKAYGFDLYSDYRILIINKDMNTNLTGYVEVTLDYTDGMRCIYLQAPNLTSTAGTTFAGMSFIGNSTDYVGSYLYYDIYPTAGSIYSIPIKYSQAVLCQQIPSPSYYRMKRGRANWQSYQLSLLIVLLFFTITIST